MEEKTEIKEEVVAEVTPEEPEQKEMTTIEKVQLMSSLANIATDNALKDSLLSKPNGDIIYDVFINAVDKKLKEIMDGKPEDVPKQVTSILAATGSIEVMLREFQRMVVGFMDTPLVEVLNLMNRNLGGKNFDFNRESVQNAAPAPARQEPNQKHQGPNRVHSTEQPQQVISQSTRNGGFGSF